MIHYLTDNPDNFTSIEPLLLEHFPTDILFINGFDIDGVSQHSWISLKAQIVDCAKKNNIKLIILDCTIDPCILDNTMGGYCPSYSDIMFELQQTCKTIIITEDWTHYYNSSDNVRYLPYHMWVEGTRSIHKYHEYQDTVYDTQLEKTKPLLCLNRNLTWHRIYLLLLLHNKSWFDKIDYSFILPMEDRLENKFAISPYITEEEKAIIRNIPTPIFLDYEDNADDIEFVSFDGGVNVNTPAYARCAINLVTETSLTEGVLLTEKTNKAIMAYQIPILITNPGANKFLEDIGIDMFSDYVPWEQWDHIEDHKSRMQKIVEFVDTIMQEPDTILEKHRSLHTRLIANKQRFHSQEFTDLVIKQLR
jgi:hypothetical protein